jgi:hypothetical protein
MAPSLGSLSVASMLALVASCSSHENFFKEPPEHLTRGGAAGSIGSGTGGHSLASGAGGSSGQTGEAAGRGASSGAATAGNVGESGGVAGAARAGASTGAAAGLASGGTTSAGTGGEATQGGTTGRAGTGGDTEAGAAGTPEVGGSGGETCVPKPEVCDGIDNDCDDAIDEDGVCPAGCSAQTREGHVYLLCLFDDQTQQLDYDQATTRCGDAGSALGLGVTLELARVESTAEEDFLKAWIVERATMDGMVWLGANDIEQEGRWVWGRGTDAVQFFVGSAQGGGTPYMDRFNDFAAGRPNSANGEDEDCGAFDSEFDWQWNDLVCSVPRLGFVCEQAS